MRRSARVMPPDCAPHWPIDGVSVYVLFERGLDRQVPAESSNGLGVFQASKMSEK
jgi:hypothetical protein